MNNYCQEILSQLEAIADKEKSKKMSAYMLNQFEFLGIQAPRRREICKPFFAEMKKEKAINWDFVFECWDCPYRELQYVALDYLTEMKKYLSDKDIPKLERLAVQKSWWDSIDHFYKFISPIALNYPKTNEILLKYSVDDNFWLRRIAICHQLLRKEKTDTILLEKIIVNNFDSTEFFINKGIGWALRNYIKTNPIWVKNFIQKYGDKMAKLSIREASKYL